MKRWIHAKEDDKLQDYIIWFQGIVDGSYEHDYEIIKDCKNEQDAINKFRRMGIQNTIVSVKPDV